jgi:G:T-mismatch repair DNA endonuclease (very short patch repair protein)
MPKRSKKIVSYVMSRIKSKGTEIEKIFAKILRKNGLKYRANVKIFAESRILFCLVPG